MDRAQAYSAHDHPRGRSGAAAPHARGRGGDARLRRAARRRRRDLGHGRPAPRLRLGDPPHPRAAPRRGRAGAARRRLRRDRGPRHPLPQHRGHRRRAREPDRLRAARLRRDHGPALAERAGAPDKDIRQVQIPSVQKKWKDKAFARGVDRAHVAVRRPRTSAAPASPAASSSGRTSPTCSRRCRRSPATSTSTAAWSPPRRGRRRAARPRPAVRRPRHDARPG